MIRFRAQKDHKARHQRVPRHPLRPLINILVGYGFIFSMSGTLGWAEIKHLLRRVMRMLRFASVGISITILGYVVLYVTVGHFGMPKWQGYIIDTGISVELNFLLSRYLTWRDRRRAVGFWRSWLWFHGARFITMALNQGLFNLQVSVLGLNYLLANTACILVSMSFNYTANDSYVFGGSYARVDHEPILPSKLPTVSIVIPCKNNADTIKPTVDALLAQTYYQLYPRGVEIILVGDPIDNTWGPIKEEIAQRQVLAVGLPVSSPGRDSNAKRSAGLNLAQGEIRVLLDSDVVPDDRWLARVVNLLTIQRQKVVAGPLLGLAKTFWGRFIDDNVGGAKTPRMNDTQLLTEVTLGQYRPPVTANLAFRTEVIQVAGGPGVYMTNSYEDYELISRFVRAGFTVLSTPILAARRYHREGLRPLIGEYRRSGMGCADHMVAHPTCPFSTWRLVQLLAVPVGFVALVLGAWFFPIPALVLACAGVLSLILTNVLIARRVEGVLYPFLGAFFSLLFVYGVCKRFALNKRRKPLMPEVGAPILVRPEDI